MNSSPGVPAPPLRVLSLDGGGIRGKSSLLILENIMETIRQAKGLESVPRPCEHFDLIGGTSTGGIIAIMLGRLGMTVDQCIQAYDRVAQTAFTPKRTSLIPASPKGAYSAQALEGAIKQTVQEFCVESPCIDQRRQGRSTVESCLHANAEFRSASCTKTVVLAITKDNVDAAPTLFTTYDTAANLSYRGCAIWQVARATSAATTFFKSIKVGRDNVEFIDAGFGYNNPCEVLIEEARRQFPKHGGLQVLSIGTGLGDIVTIKDSRRAILKALAKMASTSTTIARKLHNQYGNSGQYHRFNVERGLQDITLSDWEKTSTISAHTGNYLQDNQEEVQKFVDSFINCPQAQAEATSPQGTTTSSSVPHYISLPRNEHFVGRTETLELLNSKLFARGGHRRVCLYGLGGVGKTQVALRIAYEAKDMREFMVLWLPAASNATFQQACTEAVKRLAIQPVKDETPKELLQQYLNSEKAGKWLLIIDNIDEMDTLIGSSNQSGIDPFLPDSENGRILFTTRPYDIAVRVADDDDIVELKEMSHVDARHYLEEKLQLDQVEDDAAATELLNQLAHLPLAITQAAAYMKRNKKSVREYLNLLRRTESDTTDLMSWEFYDRSRYKESQNAVALTWQVSFKQICDVNTTAAELLRFISRIEPKSIPRSLLPISGSEIQLDDAIGTLLGYAFLDVQEGGETYDMHSLVHLATRTWIKTQGYTEKAMVDVVTHLDAVFPTDDWENRYVWRQYLPHALRVLHEDGWRSEKSTDLGYWVGGCLYEDGQYRDAIRILQGVVSAQEKTFNEDDPDRLSSEQALAIAYQENGQTLKAIEMLEHIVEVKKTTLAEDHPSRLASKHELAIAYQKNGQTLKAIEMLEHVVGVDKTTLAKNHPSRLASEYALATAYKNQGGEQVLKAVELLEHVVGLEQRARAKDDPSRLASEYTLATAYINQGGEQVLKAVELLEHVVEVEKTTLAKDHPSRLASEHALATAYINQGSKQVLKAVELLEHVVGVDKATLAEDDPSRLISECALGIAYYTNGQVREGIERLEHVVSIQRTLAEDDPERIGTERALERARTNCVMTTYDSWFEDMDQ
ncbi:acyl transferase/acyl hydrolase/lysophospholipase [Xylaria castorea]|nr:acyl transferase/acyl hydrolase/lysophospholipase [Xylaria castorea]